MAKLSILFLMTAFALAPGCGGGEDKDKSSEDGDDNKKKKKKKKKNDGDNKKKKKEKEKAKLNVKAKLGDKDVAFTHAAVVDQGTSGFVLQLATHALDCEKVSPSFVKVEEGGTGVMIKLANELKPDGKLHWVVKSANYEAPEKKRGRDLDKKAAKITKVEGTSDKQVVADVDLSIKAKEGDPLTLKGTIVAKGCGSKPSSSKKADPRPQKKLKVTVAGHTFDINSAILRKEKDGDVVLELTTAARKCDGYWAAGNFGIDMKLDDTGKQVRYVYFRGENISSDYNATHDPTGTVEVGAKKGDTIPVKVDYQRTSFEFDVQVKGDVEAVECVDKK